MVIIITLHDTQIRVYGNYLPEDDQFEVTAVETEDGTDIHEMLNTISDRYAAFLDKQIERRIGCVARN